MIYKLKIATKYLIIVTVLVWIVWDIYVFLRGGIKPTISLVITNWFWQFPQIGIGVAYVCGHLFWQNPCPKCGSK